MQKQLEVLNRLLQTANPKFYSELTPPLNETEIQVLEAKFNVTLPADLKLLYKWKNGQNQNCYKSFVNNSMFLPLEDSLAAAQELTGMIGLDFEIENWWNQRWLPIFDNGGGDLICYDLEGIFTGEKGQLIEFWHADNDRNVIAPTLESFIEAINHALETANPQDFGNDFEVDDINILPREFIVK